MFFLPLHRAGRKRTVVSGKKVTAMNAKGANCHLGFVAAAKTPASRGLGFGDSGLWLVEWSESSKANDGEREEAGRE